METEWEWAGSVSHGTMRAEDLIPVFASTLRDITREDPARTCGALLADANNLTDYESEDADWVLSDLFDALDACAAPGYYFGSHPGDGSDYGFWPAEGD